MVYDIISMKVTIEHEGQRAVVEDETVVDVCDAIDLCEKALAGVGFGEERLLGAFLVKAKQINNEL